jgi:hypothetical protein
MKLFQINQTYSATSVCDHNCKWSFTVTRRTAKTVWLKDDRNETKSFRVRVWDNAETVQPLGNYSMAPILSA